MFKHYTALATALTLVTGCSANNLLTPASSEFILASPAESAHVASPTAQAVSQPTEVIVLATETAQPNFDAGTLYEMGMQDRDAGDYSAMLDHLMASAEAGNPQAHYELANLLSKGELVVRDIDTARMYLERSAQLGNPEALRVLAWNTMRGDGVEKNLNAGVEMMVRAAEESSRAQRELGMLFANIYQPNLNDFDQAEVYLTLASKAGDAEAAYHLGRIKEGKGDALAAIELYDIASKAGYEKAENALLALERGGASTSALLPPVVKTAQPEAMFQRAMQLLSSKHSPEQEADAYVLLLMASEAGHEMAAKELLVQSGLKQQLDSNDPSWFEEARQRVLNQH